MNSQISLTVKFIGLIIMAIAVCCAETEMSDIFLGYASGAIVQS